MYILVYMYVFETKKEILYEKIWLQNIDRNNYKFINLFSDKGFSRSRSGHIR